ncbi:MAG TPA: DoxX family protein [Candidatus Angelobacter sp.]|nr:DoxX family protein [Candidatus Angelobacter sp.]
MDDEKTQPSALRIAGNVLIFLPGLGVAFFSILKFAGVPAVVQTMAADGFSGSKLMLVAVLEFLSAALFLLTPTRSLGVLVMSSLLGGAICTHVLMGEYAKAIGPVIFLTLAWIGVWLRHPQALWSLASDHAGTTAAQKVGR